MTRFTWIQRDDVKVDVSVHVFGLFTYFILDARDCIMNRNTMIGHSFSKVDVPPTVFKYIMWSWPIHLLSQHNILPTAL